jgi:hypothetical protein
MTAYFGETQETPGGGFQLMSGLFVLATVLCIIRGL